MSAAAEVDRLAPTATAEPGEVVHQVCTTCWPGCFAPDGERVALCGEDMRDECEVITTGPATDCTVCAVVSRDHLHVLTAGGAR